MKKIGLATLFALLFSSGALPAAKGLQIKTIISALYDAVDTPREPVCFLSFLSSLV